jgi:hypothetical protein
MVDVASGFAFGYDPTGRSVFYKIDSIHYSMFDVGRSMFDAYSPPKEDSLVSFSI